MDGRLLFISAGEQSGDNAAAKLAEAISIKDNQVTFIGLGGKRLAELGQIQLADVDDLSVIGFWEVAPRIFFFRKLMQKCVYEIEKNKPDAVILIDYPGFNLRLARKIKKLKIPIIYYISPQIWAWGKKRLDEIRELVDLMLPILPFEEKFYNDAEIKCQYVGHYLLEDIPGEQIASIIPVDGNLALLPGSRKQEIERMLPVMLSSAEKFYNSTGIKSVVAGIKDKIDYDSYISEQKSEFISVVYDNPRQVIYDSQLVLTASGTATLETGIIGRPMVVIYKTGYLTYQIAKRLIKLDKIALINLVLEEKIVPEIIQYEATADKIYLELQQLYSNKEKYLAIKNKLDSVKDLLGDGMASQKAADIILNYIR
jgi:lipid-A-disaccharide synthase